MSQPIYYYNRIYSLLKPYVDLCTRSSFRKYIVLGKENIPSDGAVILAPNHCNALIDALAVLAATKERKVFGARADAFTPMFSNILHFLKILPMVRQRDGLRNVLKNIDTIETITEVLENDVKFCIFNEGRHRAMHSLLPIGKGIFRSALAANERFGKNKPVYVVPVGLEYADYFRYRSKGVIVTFGQPLNITEEVRKLSGEDEWTVYQSLRKSLKDRMSSLITYLPDDPDYQGKWAIIRIAATGKDLTMQQRLEVNQANAENIEAMADYDKETLKEIMSSAICFDNERKKAGISMLSLGKKHPLLGIALKSLTALVSLPYFIFCAIMSLPMWMTDAMLRCKIKDKTFYNSASIGIKIGMTPVMIVLWACMFTCLFPWPAAAVLTLLSLPSYNFVWDYCEFTRIFVSDIRLALNTTIRNEYSNIKSTLTVFNF